MASPESIIEMADQAVAALTSPKTILRMFDVELVNLGGYSCMAKVHAPNSVQAQKLAGRRFPELNTTGLVMEVEL